MGDLPFIGREVCAAGVLKRHQLRRNHTRLFPDVYLQGAFPRPALDQRIHAAWLWSGREGVVAGRSAAHMHGARWVDREVPVELIYRSPRPPQGIIVRRERLMSGETMLVGGFVVTTPARTAFDIGRRGPVIEALAGMDALMRATGVSVASVAELAQGHRHTRGLRQLEHILSLADPGAQSPKESWVRLVLIRAGLPRPQTQIPVLRSDGQVIAYLDLGWKEAMVAVEYDGDHHRTDRYQYVKDIRRRELLEQLGWRIITVVAEDRPADIVRRVRTYLDRTECALGDYPSAVS